MIGLLAYVTSLPDTTHIRNGSDITTNLLLAYKDKDKARPAISPANTNISIIYTSEYTTTFLIASFINTAL